MKKQQKLKPTYVGQLAVEVPHNRGVAEQGMRFHHPAAAGLLKHQSIALLDSRSK